MWRVLFFVGREGCLRSWDEIGGEQLSFWQGKLHGAAAAALPAAAPLRASWPVLSTQLLNFEPLGRGWKRRGCPSEQRNDKPQKLFPQTVYLYCWGSIVEQKEVHTHWPRPSALWLGSVSGSCPPLVVLFVRALCPPLVFLSSSCPSRGRAHELCVRALWFVAGLCVRLYAVWGLCWYIFLGQGTGYNKNRCRQVCRH